MKKDAKGEGTRKRVSDGETEEGKRRKATISGSLVGKRKDSCEEEERRRTTKEGKKNSRTTGGRTEREANQEQRN